MPDFLLAHEKWAHFVTRIRLYCGHVPAPDGLSSLVTRTVEAGCAAMVEVDKSERWERFVGPFVVRRVDESEGHCKDRVRLGLFFAGCLKYLLPLLGRIEAQVNGTEWVVSEESFTGFWKERVFVKHGRSKGKEPDLFVSWNDKVIKDGEILVMAAYFFTYEEIRRVGPEVAEAVFDYVIPGKFGLLDWIVRGDETEGGALNDIGAKEAS